MKTTASDKVSAIIPNYNDAHLLPRAIDSLLRQTEPLHEIIIVDDGSTDDSVAIIHTYMEKHPVIRFIQHETNQGVCAALNHGIEASTGDYVILCAADDWYESKMIAFSKQAIRQTPRVGLICGDAMIDRFDMDKSFKRTLPYNKKCAWITPIEFRRYANIGYVGFNAGGGMLMHRGAVIEAGMLFPELRWHCDWLLYFAIAFQKGIYYIDELFIHIQMRQSGYSEGKRDWSIQKQVMTDTVLAIANHYPNLWDDFKKAALLPHYSLRYIPMFLLQPKLRQYFTLRLLWKFIIHNKAVVRIGRLFPYRVILRTRKLLKA